MSPPRTGSGPLVRRVVLVAAAAVVLYGAFIAFRGAQTMQDRLADFRWSALALALALSLGNYGLRFLKWEYYLKALDVRGVALRDSLLIFLSGFVLTVTPAKLGEAFKSLLLEEYYEVSISRSAPIVIAERLTDLIGVIALVAIGSTALPFGIVWAAAGGALAVGVLVLVRSRWVADWFLRPAAASDRTLGARIRSRLAEAWVSLRVVTGPGRLMVPTLLSILAWSLECLGLYVLVLGFDVEVQATVAMFTYATATLAGAVVPVPGGLGVVEAILEQGLVNLGHIETATATASMLLARLATLWFAVALGFVALFILRTVKTSRA